MSFVNWDQNVVPYLAKIEVDAQYARYYADKVAETCRLMQKRPPFETRAEDEINRTIVVIEDILGVLREAKMAYQSKPVEEINPTDGDKREKI